jgi:hypothetical protein
MRELELTTIIKNIIPFGGNIWKRTILGITLTSSAII